MALVLVPISRNGRWFSLVSQFHDNRDIHDDDDDDDDDDFSQVA